MWLPGTFLNQSSDTKIKVKIGQNLKIKLTVKGLRPNPVLICDVTNLLGVLWMSSL